MELEDGAEDVAELATAVVAEAAVRWLPGVPCLVKSTAESGGGGGERSRRVAWPFATLLPQEGRSQQPQVPLLIPSWYGQGGGLPPPPSTPRQKSQYEGP